MIFRISGLSLPVASADLIVLIKLGMKQYLIDGLRLNDYRKLKRYLDKNLESSPLGGIYWLPIDNRILTPLQGNHVSCHPHLFALVLEETFLAGEFLVRIKQNIKCDCMGYATKEQRDWLMDQMDAILETLGIHP